MPEGKVTGTYCPECGKMFAAKVPLVMLEWEYERGCFLQYYAHTWCAVKIRSHA